MANEPEDDDAIADAAALWLARHDRGLSAEEEREFAEWQSANPRHAVEFGQIDRAWAEFSIAKEDPDLVAMAQALERETFSPARHSRRHWWYWGGGLAAAAAITAIVFQLPRGHSGAAPARTTAAKMAAPATSYRVVPSEARQLALPDGSMVMLRGDSAVRADFSPASRRVHLVRGEAFFSVMPDGRRPFVVNAGAISVRAVGTAFNVRLESTAINVLVTEGTVRVDDTLRGESLLPATAQPADPERTADETGDAAPAVLPAGNRAIITLAGDSPGPTKAQVLAVSRGKMDQDLSWQNTYLEFNGTPLGEVMEAFNRHGGYRLELGDPSLERRQFGGTFRADNPEGFIRLLEKSAGIRAERSAGGKHVVLWPAR